MAKSILFIVAVLALGGLAYSWNSSALKEAPVKPIDTSSQANASTSKPALAAAAGPSEAELEKTDWSQVDWQSRLTPQEFAIMRQADTERPFTGEYWDFFEQGAYKCRGCGLELFASDAKFDAHCGWPSFDKAVSDNAVVEIADNTHGMRRIEVRCRRCDAHLGHVFDDGPTATGLRYCMNSASIKFSPATDTPAEK
jgi:peptide-methionine (R)-S-oxide reductase